MKTMKIRAAYFAKDACPAELKAAMSPACRDASSVEYENWVDLLGYWVAEIPEGCVVFPVGKWSDYPGRTGELPARETYPAWEGDALGGSYECGRAEIVKGIRLGIGDGIAYRIELAGTVGDVREWMTGMGFKPYLNNPDADDDSCEVDGTLVYFPAATTGDLPLCLWIPPEPGDLGDRGDAMGWWDVGWTPEDEG